LAGIGAQKEDGLMKKNNPTISLCMIVKNEESHLEQAIRSVQSLVTEVIVLDTGSEDNTIAIAEKCGAKVYQEPWTDDFSEARNKSLSYASCDWILILDADEQIAQQDLARLQSLSQLPPAAYLLTQRHYMNDYSMSGFEPNAGEYPSHEKSYGGYCSGQLTRFFPNHCGYRFQNKVCELVEPSIRAKNAHQIIDSTIPIHHYGYCDDTARVARKAQLYARLGEERVKDEQEPWRAYFELGIDYLSVKKYEESLTALVRSLEHNGSYVPTWINLGYVFMQMGQLADATTTFQTAIDLDPKSHEAHCNIGVLQMHCRKYAEATESFFRAISIKDNYVNAYVNLGKSMILQARYSEAACIYSKALEILPGCAVAKVDLGVLFFSASDFEKAESYYKSALEDDPNYGQCHLYLAQLYEETGRSDDKEAALADFAILEMRSAKKQGGLAQDQLNCTM
jgi:Tfp pilus assembly protein PilF